MWEIKLGENVLFAVYLYMFVYVSKSSEGRSGIFFTVMFLPFHVVSHIAR